MKNLVILAALLFITILCNAQAVKTNCFVSYGGTSYCVPDFLKLRGDTVVFSKDNVMSFVPVDSLAVYQTSGGYYTGRGILLGMLGGFTIGFVAGAILSKDDEIFTPAVGGAILGVVCLLPGAVIGGVIGGSQPKDDIIVDFKKYNREEKKRLIMVFVNEYASEKKH